MDGTAAVRLLRLYGMGLGSVANTHIGCHHMRDILHQISVALGPKVFGHGPYRRAAVRR